MNGNRLAIENGAVHRRGEESLPIRRLVRQLRLRLLWVVKLAWSRFFQRREEFRILADRHLVTRNPEFRQFFVFLLLVDERARRDAHPFIVRGQFWGRQSRQPCAKAIRDRADRGDHGQHGQKHRPGPPRAAAARHHGWERLRLDAFHDAVLPHRIAHVLQRVQQAAPVRIRALQLRQQAARLALRRHRAHQRQQRAHIRAWIALFRRGLAEDVRDARVVLAVDVNIARGQAAVVVAAARRVLHRLRDAVQHLRHAAFIEQLVPLLDLLQRAAARQLPRVKEPAIRLARLIQRRDPCELDGGLHADTLHEFAHHLRLVEKLRLQQHQRHRPLHAHLQRAVGFRLVFDVEPVQHLVIAQHRARHHHRRRRGGIHRRGKQRLHAQQQLFRRIRPVFQHRRAIHLLLKAAQVKARREKHAQVRETRPRLVPQRKTRLSGIENRLRHQHVQRLCAGDPGLRRARIRQRRHREARQPLAQESSAAFQQLGIGIDEKEDHRGR